MNNNFETITFTTFGYKDFTENLLQSIITNKTDLNINVYALDKKSENYFNKIHNKVTQISFQMMILKILWIKKIKILET